MKRLRVLVVSPAFPPQPGGIELLTHRIATGLVDSEVQVLTLGNHRNGSFDRDSPVPIRRIGVPGPHAARVAVLNAATLSTGLARRPDVVLSAHVAVAPGAMALSRAARVPYVQYAHAMELMQRRPLSRAALRHASAVVAVSRYTRDLCTSLGADQRRVRVIPPGVDASAVAAPSRTRVPGRIVTVARLDELYKGHDVMLRALPLVRAAVPHAHWKVIGDGTLRGHLAALAAAAGIEDAVQWAGRVDDTGRDQALDEAEVFAMVSRVPPGGAGEGFGIAFLEAGLHELPVVAGRAGGALDAVRDGETGVLVDPHDHVAVANALIALLRAADRRREMGAEGRRHAQSLDFATTARRVEELLTEVAG